MVGGWNSAPFKLLLRVSISLIQSVRLLFVFSTSSSSFPLCSHKEKWDIIIYSLLKSNEKTRQLWDTVSHWTLSSSYFFWCFHDLTSVFTISMLLMILRFSCFLYQWSICKMRSWESQFFLSLFKDVTFLQTGIILDPPLFIYLVWTRFRHYCYNGSLGDNDFLASLTDGLSLTKFPMEVEVDLILDHMHCSLVLNHNFWAVAEKSFC